MIARPLLVLGVAGVLVAVANIAALSSSSCAAGSLAPDPQDGSAGAPTGIAPAYPRLFAHYKTRPRWPVADVDYAAGNPLHGRGVDWQAPGALPACADHAFRGQGNVVTMQITSDCKLVGLNFCTGQGVGFYGANVNVDFENDDFCALRDAASGGNDIINLQGASSVILKDVDFNGEAERGMGSSNNAGLLEFTATGPLTVEYLRAYNVGNHVLDVGERAGVSNTSRWLIAYNSGLNTGMASNGPSPAHGEFEYVCGGAITDVHIVGNTGVEEAGTPNLSNAAPFPLVGDPSCAAPGTITNSEVGWNVSVVQGRGAEGSADASTVASAAAFFVSGKLSGVSLHDNYIDWTGAYFPFYQVPAGNSVLNNIDLVTGRVCSEVTPATRGDPWWRC